jgi:hypothetical protein
MDANQLGKHIVDIATGQKPKPVEKNPAAVELGRKGGEARAKSLSPERRREISLSGVKAKSQQKSSGDQ